MPRRTSAIAVSDGNLISLAVTALLHRNGPAQIDHAQNHKSFRPTVRVVATEELAVCYLLMDQKGVRYELVQSVHPSGWKWIAHISRTKQTTGFSSSKELAIHAARRAIEKALNEADDKK